MKRTVSKILLAVMALVMIVSMLPLSAMAAPVTYTVNFSDEQYPAFGQNEKADYEFDKYGDNDYFTVFYAAKTKYDTSKKTFEDGLSFTRRMNFQGKTEFTEEGVYKAVMFKAEGPGTVKLWWVCGDDGRHVALYDAEGNILVEDDGEALRNSLYITELAIPAAGTYYLGNPQGSNYYFQISATVEPAEVEPPIEPENPGTGDNAAIFMAIVLLSVSMGGILLVKKYQF